MNQLTTSCILAALGIALGAFGAHGLESILLANGHDGTWNTAVLYHLIHSVSLFALATSKQSLRSKWAFPLWTIGIVLFSGSLYTLSLTSINILGAITPFGGLAFIAGWISLILENRKS